MAKADDTPSTSNWISWDEALTRAGSPEALLSWLREVPVLARHQGLFYSPSGKPRSGPGKFDPVWWAEARVDPATKRVILLLPEMYWLDFTGFAGDHAPPAVVPRTTEEVFAFGIELERGAAEVRFPAQPNPPEPEPEPEPEHVEAPEQKRQAPQTDRVRAAIAKRYPNGTDGIPTKAVHRAVVDELKPDSRKHGLPFHPRRPSSAPLAAERNPHHQRGRGRI